MSRKMLCEIINDTIEDPDPDFTQDLLVDFE